MGACVTEVCFCFLHCGKIEDAPVRFGRRLPTPLPKNQDRFEYLLELDI